MINYFDNALRQSKAVKLASTTAAAAHACNHVLGENYELWWYDKNGEVMEDARYVTWHRNGIDQNTVRLLESGRFAKSYPKEKLYRKVQDCFDKELPKYERDALDRARIKLEERLKVGAFIVVLLGFFLYYGLAGARDRHMASVAQNKDLTANNQQVRTNVDNVFSFLLPCTPSGAPLITVSIDLKSTQVSCSQQDSTGAITFFYQLENEVYMSSKYSPKDDYTNCAAYTSDQGERYTIIDSHIEDVHGIKFAICNMAGSSGTVDIIAHAISGNTMQYVRLITDQQHQNNVWITFRGQLESFRYF